MRGYTVAGQDDACGTVKDFLVDDEYWVVRYLVLDTGNWLPGRKVILAPAWVKDVTWADRKVIVDLSQEQIKGSPEFNPDEPVNRQYEVRLYDYYGRPKYWE
jgi:hypothetical protein